AERLNLYLDRQEGEDEHEEEAIDEGAKKKSRWKRCCRRRDSPPIDMSFGVNDGGVFGPLGPATAGGDNDSSTLRRSKIPAN
ncbi:hypothetical protein ANCDUO_21584, partial [Ancylostoma duodenale]